MHSHITHALQESDLWTSAYGSSAVDFDAFHHALDTLHQNGAALSTQSLEFLGLYRSTVTSSLCSNGSLPIALARVHPHIFSTGAQSAGTILRDLQGRTAVSSQLCDRPFHSA